MSLARDRPERDDGRNVDASLGALTGEAATVAVELPEHAYPTIREVLARVPSETDDLDPTYYDEPVLKAPVWIWTVPAYFFVGGVAGVSAALAAAAAALDARGLAGLVRRAHALTAVGEVVCSGLLIHDLGRPARFLYMLRVFRPTSPMSVGSWVLAASSATSSLAALLGGRRGALGRVGAAAGYASGGLGLVLAGYTGVLLATTAVPVWQGGRRALPPLFLASAAASAGAALDLLPLRPRERAVARRFAILGAAAQVALGSAYVLEVSRSPRAALPLRAGVSGALWHVTTVLAAAGLVVSAAPGKKRRSREVLADMLLLAGALGVRISVFLAGKASARDPRATFRQQRAGLGAAEVAPR